MKGFGDYVTTEYNDLYLHSRSVIYAILGSILGLGNSHAKNIDDGLYGHNTLKQHNIQAPPALIISRRGASRMEQFESLRIAQMKQFAASC